MQDATISPGDYLIGDLNGVVCLPKGLAERAVALIGSQVEADEYIARDLKLGRTFSEASKEHRASIMIPPKPSSGGEPERNI
jgi:regulator of RNase E activity RraA